MNNSELHIHNLLKDIPIFWINLKRSEKRRLNMELNFKKYDLKNIRVEAIDGNDIIIDEYKKKYTINEKMNNYEIACALSHMKVIKQCYDEKLPYALILEDDATFEYFKYKTETLLEIIKNLNELNGECLQLANIIPRKVFNSLNLQNKFIKMNTNGAQSYLITKKGMKSVINNFEKSKHIQVSEFMIFKNSNTYLTPPYFSYPFLRNDQGEKVNLSTIRDNTKSAHATQTISKLLWDEYYQKFNEIKIYWINLERSHNRKVIMEKQLSEFNIVNHERIVGIDGKNIDFKDYENNCENINVFELGCTLSHLKAIKTAYENDDKYALILEDDCSFEYIKYQDYSITQLIEKMNNENKDWGILQLCTSGRIDQNERMRDNLNLIEKKNKNCTTAYLITRKGMKNILNCSEKYIASDYYIYHYTNTFFLTKPYFTYFYSNVVKSDIRNQGENINETNYKREDNSKKFWDNYYLNK